jgi:NitT/TauT family transport system substrate-binding protein
LGEFLANPDTIQHCLVTSEPFFAAQKGREVRTFTLSSSGYDCYQMVFTRRDLVRNSPDVVRAFVQASIRGWRDYLEKDPSPANALILKRNPQMTAELVEFSRGELIRHSFARGDPAKGENYGLISLERLTREMNTLLGLKILEKPVDIASIATTEFCRP